MAIDIRAEVTCSLGTLIRASISDDYIQETGLIKTSGSCELYGLYSPAVGTLVSFEYTKKGTTRTVPRALRVLSSFADPFRNTTQVQLGCKLTYLEDLKESIDWTAYDDPENATLTEEDAKIITIPIYANSIAAECLTQLGLSGGQALTNKFSVESFDLSPGYVQVLSDLYVSECFCCYLDKNESLESINLNVTGGSGKYITPEQIIDIGPLGFGKLPGDAVTVSYSTLKLVNDDDLTDQTESILWEKAEETTGPYEYIVASLVYTGNETTVTETKYENIADNDLPVLRTTTTTASSAKIAGKLGSEYITNNIKFNAIDVVIFQSVETLKYDDEGNEIENEVVEYKQALELYGGLEMTYVFSTTDYVTLTYSLLEAARTYTVYDNNGDIRQTSTTEYGLWPFTRSGQYAFAQYTKSGQLDTSTEVANYINSAALMPLVPVRNTLKLETVGKAPSRPSSSDLINQEYADGGDPNNGYRTESTSELELAYGSETAQLRIEFDMPYAPDDYFYKDGDIYGSIASDASQKAANYGRVQNALLLGNRYGVNLQLAPEDLPGGGKPFEPFTLQANGLSAVYRTNAISYEMDANGIVASVDALFWGGNGSTDGDPGSPWFPVAPGITTLPVAPPVVDTSPTTILGTVSTVGNDPQAILTATFPSAISGDGVQNTQTDDFWVYDGSTWNNVGSSPGLTTVIETVIPAWNETFITESVVKTKLIVQNFSYALDLLTEVDPIILNTGFSAIKVSIIVVPSKDVILYTWIPKIKTGFSYRPPAIVVSTAAQVPVSQTGKKTYIPSVDTICAAFDPAYAGPQATVIPLSQINVSLFALIPTIKTGKNITLGNVDFATLALVPVFWREPAYYSNSSYGYAGSGSVSVPWPTPYAVNDIGVMVIETSATDATQTPPSGWTAVTGSPVVDVASTAGSKLQVWWKRATTTSEPSVTIGSFTDHYNAKMFTFKGAKTTNNPINASVAGTKTIASYYATVPSITPTETNSLIVMIVGRPDDNASSTHFASQVNANLFALTEITDIGTTFGNGGGYALITGQAVTTQPTGTTTMTKLYSTTDTYLVFAISPIAY